MSTLTVTFSLPGQSVVTSTTSSWDIGHQVDQAAAALVSVAQAVITIGLWALIVGLPVALVLLVAWGLLWFAPRRLLRRRHKADVNPV
jgi:Flp pilus assembly protein TadB